MEILVRWSPPWAPRTPPCYLVLRTHVLPWHCLQVPGGGGRQVLEQEMESPSQKGKEEVGDGTVHQLRP